MSAPQRRLRVGRPLWLPDIARVQQRYPALSGQHDTAVAVVGGGMTGALVAHAFASAGGSGRVLKQVVTAAELVREVLTTLKLRSWVKTTGGRGLHVVVPLKPKRTVRNVSSSRVP